MNIINQTVYTALKRSTEAVEYNNFYNTITVFITILEQNRQNSCHNSTKLSEENVKNIFTSHIDKKTFLTFLFLTTYLMCRDLSIQFHIIDIYRISDCLQNKEHLDGNRLYTTAK
jgi:hypothetical protein